MRWKVSITDKPRAEACPTISPSKRGRLQIFRCCVQQIGNLASRSTAQKPIHPGRLNAAKSRCNFIGSNDEFTNETLQIVDQPFFIEDEFFKFDSLEINAALQPAHERKREPKYRKFLRYFARTPKRVRRTVEGQSSVKVQTPPHGRACSDTNAINCQIIFWLQGQRASD